MHKKIEEALLEKVKDAKVNDLVRRKAMQSLT